MFHKKELILGQKKCHLLLESYFAVFNCKLKSTTTFQGHVFHQTIYTQKKSKFECVTCIPYFFLREIPQTLSGRLIAIVARADIDCLTTKRDANCNPCRQQGLDYRFCLQLLQLPFHIHDTVKFHKYRFTLISEEIVDSTQKKTIFSHWSHI